MCHLSSGVLTLTKKIYSSDMSDCHFFPQTASVTKQSVYVLCRTKQVAEWPHRENGNRVSLRTTRWIPPRDWVTARKSAVTLWLDVPVTDSVLSTLCGALLKIYTNCCSEMCHSCSEPCLPSVVVLLFTPISNNTAALVSITPLWVTAGPQWNHPV